MTLGARQAAGPHSREHGGYEVLPRPGTPLHRDRYLVSRREPLPPPAARLVSHMLHTGAFRAPDQEDPT